jgi:hypothetical protein
MFGILEPMRVLLVIALSACSMACATSAPTGPAWPRSAGRGDGGESLAPHAAARAISAISEEDRATDRDADKPAAPPPLVPVAPERPAVTASSVTPPPSDEPMTTEEIVIEVED